MQTNMAQMKGHATPPWQTSQTIGGDYVWNSQTDEIILRTGRRYPRPPKISKSALANARYDEPLPFEYGGSPPAHPGFMVQPGQAQAQGGNPAHGQAVPRGSNLQAINNAMGQMNLAQQGGPAGRQQLTSQAAPARPIPNVDPRRDTHAYIQPPTRSQIARKEPAVQVDGHGRSVQLGAQAAAVTRSLFPSFQVRSDAKRYFKVGKVFLILWSENAGEPTNGTVATAWHPGIVLNQLGERVFSKVRRFVVIREGAKWCHALPISTYGGKGVAKSGVVKSEHVIIHTTRNPPGLGQGESPKRNESGMRPVPIRAEPDVQGAALDPMSRLNLGGVTLIQHNNKVEHFGRIAQASVHELLTQFGNVWGHAPVPAPQRLLPPADGDDVAQDEPDNNEESDEEEDDEVDSDAENSD
jgi:hypothetical protein